MSSNLTSTYSLGDVADVFDGPHATPKKLEQGDAIFLSISSLEQGRLNLEQSSYISEDDYIKWTRRVTPQPGDVVFSYETKIGEASIIPEGLRCCLGRRMGLLRAKRNKVIPDFLLYAYLSPAFQEVIREKTIHGSTTDRLSIKEMPSFKIQIPDVRKQNKIIKILKSIDGKLGLNQQVKKTLEQMAQALFKSWFVDFEPVKAKMAVLEAGGSQENATRAAMTAISGKDADALAVFQREQPEYYAELQATAELFPSAMQASELGDIPEGWCTDSIKSICDVVDYVANGSFAALKENVNLYDTPNDVLYVRTTDFNKGFSTNLKYTDNESYNFLKKSSLVGTEVIISNVGDVGTVFRPPSWLGMPMTLASNAIAIKSDKLNEFLCLYFKSNIGQHAISSIITGSAQLKFNKTSFRALKLVLPTDGILDSFNKIAIINTKMLNSLNAKTYSLTQLRDTLLPKLLSGEITLPEAEQAVSEAENV
ncbi:restriction endonuclease subunit S [Yokenella regensburgei]|uniref:restriction endonuclease subunit S n=1 Tax=Yokenella regensburgei TaxID=158877 RepID=UPI0035B08AD5